ncbi:MAG: Gfo/Idh/MocA family oxidoreductase [Lentisphaeria bacterium]|nr:Gfo/Idh/MocA family oxidoreductase [Lentisphaeria bacterium]
MRRVVLAGCGTRALNFADGLLHRVSEYSQLVGLYDNNPARMEGFKVLIGNGEVPCFTDFDTMLRTVKPDTMVVLVPDRLHPEFVERGFAAGLNVVTEKPMAMDREGVNRIRAAEIKYGKEVVVTFNMRFSPYSAAIKKVMMDHPVGRITSVNAEWFIDRTHGNEYFHRWHSDMKNGGGLLVHKGTHHFDMLNWFLEDEPYSVYATAGREVYGDANPFYGERCTNCPHAHTCWAVLKSTLEDADLNPGTDGNIFNELYFKAEKIDGYRRDRCCFDRKTDIYDTMNAIITYKGGARVNYCETAYAPWQGYNIVFNGTAGRVEVGTVNRATRPENFRSEDYIRIITGTTRQNIVMRELPFQEALTPHGGGDYAMFDQLFGAGGPDPLGQVAGSRAGALSALVGITANESIRSGKVELIDF